MKNNIKKLYNRFSIVQLKERRLLIFIFIQSIGLSLLSLVFANTIISGGIINDELNYYQIKLFYTLSILLFFFMPSLYSAYFLGRSINSLVNSNSILYLLSVECKPTEIVFARFIRGLFNVYILIFASFPILSISFYFGGIGYIKLIRLFVMLMFYILLTGSISMFISSMVKETNNSIILAFIVDIFIFILHYFIIGTILLHTSILFTYCFMSVIFSSLFFNSSRKSRIFNIL